MYNCKCPDPAQPSCTGIGKGGGVGGGGAGVGSAQHGGGGGYVSKGQDAPSGNGKGGSPWGDQPLTVFAGGSGGGGGSWKQSVSNVSSGGAGGGAVKIIAPSILVSGSVSVDGGAGGQGQSYDNANRTYGAGGGGSGGSVWLRARVIEVTGSITAKGGPGGTYNAQGTYGGAGADGRIRLDYSTGSPVTDPPFYKGDNGPDAGMVGLSMYQVKAGTVRVDNQTGAQQTVMLVIVNP
jgi:hypothetical protein